MSKSKCAPMAAGFRCSNPQRRPSGPSVLSAGASLRWALWQGSASGWVSSCCWSSSSKTIRRPAELAQLLQSQPLATIPTIRPPSKTHFPNYRRHIAAMLVMGVLPLSPIDGPVSQHGIGHAIAKSGAGVGCPLLSP